MKSIRTFTFPSKWNIDFGCCKYSCFWLFCLLGELNKDVLFQVFLVNQVKLWKVEEGSSHEQCKKKRGCLQLFVETIFPSDLVIFS